MLSNQRHELFAQELAQGKLPEEAFEIAGFKRHRQNAHRLMTRDYIQGRVKELLSRRERGVIITRQRVLEEYASLAFAAKDDPLVPVAVKRVALQDLAKMEGWFVERSETGKPGDFTRMNDHELDDFIKKHQATVPANVNKKVA